MPDFDNTNRGAIWGNDKDGNDRRPDFKGSLNVNGEEYWVSAWKRKPNAKERAPALTFSIEKKEAKYQNSEKPAPANNFDDFDDDIPF